MTSAVMLALLLTAPPLSLGERVEGARAVEMARYAFVIGATRPFDEVYPRAVFETKVKRELAGRNGLKIAVEELRRQVRIQGEQPEAV